MVVEYWISWRERKDRRKGAVEILYRVTKRKRQGARECYKLSHVSRRLTIGFYSWDFLKILRIKDLG